MSKSTPAPVEGKTCRKCGEWKCLDRYPLRSQGSGDGRRSECRPCYTARIRAWKLANPRKPGKARIARGCLVPDCGRPHTAKGLCDTHYHYRWKHGSDRPPGCRTVRAAPPPGRWTCTKCGECKPTGCFPKTKNARGHGSWCKECVARHNRARYTAPEVRADRLARRQRWGAENPHLGS